MKKISKPFLLVLFIFNLNIVNLAFSSNMAGFNFLRTNVGARYSAIAGAAVAIPGDIHSIYYNPAGLASIDKQIGSVTYLNHVLDFHSGFLGYAHFLQGVGTVGFSINYIDYGSFDETNDQGVKLGRTFGANSFVVTASISNELFSGVLGGVNLKYIRSAIDNYTADAYAFDAGVIYRVPFIEDLDIGLTVLNVGKSISAFIDTKEDLPLKIAGGFSKKLAHLPLLFNAYVYKFIDDDFQFAGGGEFNLAEGIYLRLGYDSIGRDQKVNGNKDSIAGFSIGFGFNWKDYQLDYAFSSLGDVGSLNRVTFSNNF